MALLNPWMPSSQSSLSQLLRELHLKVFQRCASGQRMVGGADAMAGPSNPLRNGLQQPNGSSWISALHDPDLESRWKVWWHQTAVIFESLALESPRRSWAQKASISSWMTQLWESANIQNKYIAQHFCLFHYVSFTPNVNVMSSCL